MAERRAHDGGDARAHDHEVRNVLALLRGHLELARESLDSGAADQAVPDVADAIAATRRLEALLDRRPAGSRGAARTDGGAHTDAAPGADGA